MGGPGTHAGTASGALVDELLASLFASLRKVRNSAHASMPDFPLGKSRGFVPSSGGKLFFQQSPQHNFTFFPLSCPCSTLSQCCHAVVALLYPFVWQHTYIPVLPSAMLDIVCTPTPFIVGLLSSSLTQLNELPLEEVRLMFWLTLHPAIMKLYR